MWIHELLQRKAKLGDGTPDAMLSIAQRRHKSPNTAALLSPAIYHIRRGPHVAGMFCRMFAGFIGSIG